MLIFYRAVSIVQIKNPIPFLQKKPYGVIFITPNVNVNANVNANVNVNVNVNVNYIYIYIYLSYFFYL